MDELVRVAGPGRFIVSHGILMLDLLPTHLTEAVHGLGLVVVLVAERACEGHCRQRGGDGRDIGGVAAKTTAAVHLSEVPSRIAHCSTEHARLLFVVRVALCLAMLLKLHHLGLVGLNTDLPLGRQHVLRPIVSASLVRQAEPDQDLRLVEVVRSRVRCEHLDARLLVLPVVTRHSLAVLEVAHGDAGEHVMTQRIRAAGPQHLQLGGALRTRLLLALYECSWHHLASDRSRVAQLLLAAGRRSWLLHLAARVFIHRARVAAQYDKAVGIVELLGTCGRRPAGRTRRSFVLEVRARGYLLEEEMLLALHPTSSIRWGPVVAWKPL